MRDRSMEIAGLSAILVLGGLVAVARHPDAPWVERAAGWPVVGWSVRAVQERWRPPPAPEPPDTPPVAAPRPGAVARGTRPSSARNENRAAPPAAGKAAAQPEADEDVLRIAAGPTTVLPLPGRRADPVRLARLREHLERDGPLRERSVGRYRLLADLDPGPGLDEWPRIAEVAETVWRRRYGVVPLGEARETLVLVRRESTYREVARALFPGGPEADGLSAYGMVVMPVEGRDPGALTATFQHEIGHLLARRSLGPELPAWLAEGLAEDFGQAPLDGRGGLDFARWRGAVTRVDLRFEIVGGLAGLDRLGRGAAAGLVPGLGQLAAVPREEFAAGAAGPERYAAAAAWIRFLLDDPRRAPALRGFLAEIEAGGAPTLDALERHLATSSTALVADFGRWLLATWRRELERAGVPGALFRDQPGEQPASGSSSRQRELPSP